MYISLMAVFQFSSQNNFAYVILGPFQSLSKQLLKTCSILSASCIITKAEQSRESMLLVMKRKTKNAAIQIRLSPQWSPCVLCSFISSFTNPKRIGMWSEKQSTHRLFWQWIVVLTGPYPAMQSGNMYLFLTLRGFHMDARGWSCTL